MNIQFMCESCGAKLNTTVNKQFVVVGSHPCFESSDVDIALLDRTQVKVTKDQVRLTHL